MIFSDPIPVLVLAVAAFANPAFAVGTKLAEGDEPSAAQGPKAEFRANQVNRCVDAGGRVKLQDTPCAPVTAPPVPATASAVAADVVDLAALPPRDADRPAPVRPREADAASWTSVALSAAWKIALCLAAAYALYRGVRAWRQSFALKSALAEAPRRTR